MLLYLFVCVITCNFRINIKHRKLEKHWSTGHVRHYFTTTPTPTDVSFVAEIVGVLRRLSERREERDGTMWSIFVVYCVTLSVYEAV